MPPPDPLSPDPNDTFGPPAIPTLVGCLHCQEEYESYLIEWRIEPDGKGLPRGWWCCPTPGCDGKGFGFDILPCDPTYQDENGGWVQDDEDDDGEREFERFEDQDEDDDDEPEGWNDPPRRSSDKPDPDDDIPF